MTDLMEMASRVEAGGGPDLQLDRDIFDALRIVPSREHFPVYPHYAYTASTDAAMTLIPDGWRIYTADFSIEGRCTWLLKGPMAPWTDPEDGEELIAPMYAPGAAATPALALTAAALRARAHQGAAHVDQ